MLDLDINSREKNSKVSAYQRYKDILYRRTLQLEQSEFRLPPALLERRWVTCDFGVQKPTFNRNSKALDPLFCLLFHIVASFSDYFNILRTRLKIRIEQY